LSSAQPTQPADGEDERRHQQRVPLSIKPGRARRWAGGAWREVEATVVDLSPRGIGLTLSSAVQVGDRLSLTLPLEDGHQDLRLTIELRHARVDEPGRWRAGGLLRNLAPEEHERLTRYIGGRRSA
jgi:hypothetical protein